VKILPDSHHPVSISSSIPLIRRPDHFSISGRRFVTSPTEKPQVMKDMERVGFEEIPNFLISGEEVQLMI
jgi:hypothetical protein